VTPIVVAALAASHPALGRRARSTAAVLGLVTASAVIVHLSGGVIEAHFHFFVMVGVITLYQDWLPFGLALGYVVVHHTMLGLLAPTEVFNHPAANNDRFGHQAGDLVLKEAPAPGGPRFAPPTCWPATAARSSCSSCRRACATTPSGSSSGCGSSPPW
jgi:hypothetical protein